MATEMVEYGTGTSAKNPCLHGMLTISPLLVLQQKDHVGQEMQERNHPSCEAVRNWGMFFATVRFYMMFTAIYSVTPLRRQIQGLSRLERCHIHIHRSVFGMACLYS